MPPSFISKAFDYTGDGMELVHALRHRGHAFILQSSRYDLHRGRYTFIGFDPFDTFQQKGEPSLNALKEKFAIYKEGAGEDYTSSLTPLTCGIVGCIGYDFGLHQERIPLQSKDDLGLPDCFFGFYDRIITIDHFTQKLIITSSGLPESGPDERLERARRRLQEMEELLNGLVDSNPEENWFEGDLKPNMSRARYGHAVRRALDHIGEGDIYQVNLSQRFEMDIKHSRFDPCALYSALSRYSPSPFGGYMDCGQFQLISNSPERFLNLQGRRVQTRPMKGTRPRSTDEQQDALYRQELLDSEKERSELLMITDLQRNDLGRVCDYGSIEVTEQRTLEDYRYVFQATSNISGKLREDKDCFDLIQACFPGGSITGCPKIRAMNIIEELEPTRRGMYTGSMGYINFNGNLDLNILIRTVIVKDGTLYFQVGSGIVADSDPDKEYEETLVKASALMACLNKGKETVKQ